MKALTNRTVVLLLAMAAVFTEGFALWMLSRSRASHSPGFLFWFHCPGMCLVDSIRLGGIAAVILVTFTGVIQFLILFMLGYSSIIVAGTIIKRSKLRWLHLFIIFTLALSTASLMATVKASPHWLANLSDEEYLAYSLKEIRSFFVPIVIWSGLSVFLLFAEKERKANAFWGLSLFMTLGYVLFYPSYTETAQFGILYGFHSVWGWWLVMLMGKSRKASKPRPISNAHSTPPSEDRVS